MPAGAVWPRRARSCAGRGHRSRKGEPREAILVAQRVRDRQRAAHAVPEEEDRFSRVAARGELAHGVEVLHRIIETVDQRAVTVRAAVAAVV